MLTEKEKIIKILISIAQASRDILDSFEFITLDARPKVIEEVSQIDTQIWSIVKDLTMGE